MSSYVHPKLAAHAKRHQKELIPISERVYLAFSFNIASCTLIIGKEGVVIVDTLANEDAAQEAFAAFQEVTNKPVKAIIYTHFHNDHVNGVQAFTTPQAVAQGEVAIYAHEALLANTVSVGGYLGPIISRRSTYTFGAFLPRDEKGFVSGGIGVNHNPGPRGFIPPTHTIKERTALSLCGVAIELIPCPGETDDQLVVWLPDEKILISADTIQGETFPNLYTLRGTKFRDPMQWVDSLESLLEIPAEIMVPHHGRPLYGQAQIRDVILAHRDAIQYVHDQTIRHMNHGRTPAEIVEKVTMPPSLKDHPWLGEFYGTFKHAIPAIYAGYLGWFQGDPTDLDSLPRAEKAQRYVDLMGGRETVLAKAQEAIQAEEYTWAGELLRHLIVVNPQDPTACQLKAEALRKWGYAQFNANWRNWALMCALELDPPESNSPKKGFVMAPPGVAKAFSTEQIFRTMTVRLKAEVVGNTRLVVAFTIRDLKKSHALEIRNGIAQFHAHAPCTRDAELTFERSFLTEMILQKTTWPQGIQEGTVEVQGNVAVVDRFFRFFEPRVSMGEIQIVKR